MERRYRLETRTITVPRHLAEARELAFEVSLFETVLKREPENVEAMLALGNAYTRRGQYEAGLKIDLKLVELLPDDSTAHYNLACSYSLLGNVEQAIEKLHAAIEFGYDDPEFMRTDPDLENLRHDRRFEELLSLMENWETS
ncbi:MAG: tetratricopeptide repeat protein [Planctomycetota bacterium]|nr:MAG: tetratricopeptide repeat protein [Planctomycetota bacterium]